MEQNPATTPQKTEIESTEETVPGSQKSTKKILIILACVVVAVVVIILGVNLIFSNSLQAENPAEINWLKSGDETQNGIFGKSTAVLFKKTYDFTITEKGFSSYGKSYIKLESDDGLSFYYFYKPNSFSDVPGYYGYWLEKDSEEYTEPGDILFKLNQDKIHQIAAQYNGTFVEDSQYFRILAFSDEESRIAFANAVANLEMIKPATEYCGHVPIGEDCSYLSPVSINKDINDYSFGSLNSLEDLWAFVSK